MKIVKHIGVSTICAVLLLGCGGSVTDIYNNIIGKEEIKIQKLSIPTSMTERATTAITASLLNTVESNTSTYEAVWSVSEGEVEDKNSLTTKYTAPSIDTQRSVQVSLSVCLKGKKICDAKSGEIIIVPGSIDNSPPMIHGISISGTELLEKGELPISAIVTDGDGDELLYLWSAKEGTFEDHTALSTTYRAPEVFGEDKVDTLTLLVSDSKATTSHSIFVTILDDSNAGQNTRPVIEQISHPKDVHASDNIALSALAYDLDGDALTYFWSVDKGTINNIKSSDILYTPPTLIDSSTNVAFSLTVCDSKNLCTNRDNIYMTIYNDDTQIAFNSKPVIEEISYPTDVLSSDNIALSALAYDLDGDALTYFWSVNKGTIDNIKSSDIIYTPPTVIESNTTANFVLSVCDGKECVKRDDISINIIKNGNNSGLTAAEILGID